MSSVARRELEGGVDPSRGALCESDALVVSEWCDQIGGGIEPDMLVDGVLGGRDVEQTRTR